MQGNGNATLVRVALLEGLLRHLDQNMSPNFLDLTEPQRGESAPEVISMKKRQSAHFWGLYNQEL